MVLVPLKKHSLNPARNASSSPMFRPKRNGWRTSRTRKLAGLIGGEAFKVETDEHDCVDRHEAQNTGKEHRYDRQYA